MWIKLSSSFLLTLLVSSAWAATTFTKRYPHSQIITAGEVSPDEYDAYIAYLQHLRDNYPLQKDYCNTHRQHSFFDIFRITARCPVPLQLYPLTEKDGSKFGCNLEALAKPCVVYSIGSENNFEWEKSILEIGCEVHTFDCYASGGGAPVGVTFHRWCVDGHDHGNHYTIGTMMKMLNHSRVDFLKMDVEGAEFQSLASIEDFHPEQLPSQIAVEIHPWASLPENGRTPIKLRQTIDLMLSLHRMGYQLLSRFDNFPHPCCSEFLYGIPERLPGAAKKGRGQAKRLGNEFLTRRRRINRLSRRRLAQAKKNEQVSQPAKIQPLDAKAIVSAAENKMALS